MTELLNRLREGNIRYIGSVSGNGDISPQRREDTALNGQHPFAVIVCCSDSRVIPEEIFSCGIGDLFVIRTAGNTVGASEAGSIDYALGHLGVKLVAVMGHTGCGAVAAAIGGHAEGHAGHIVKKIEAAIGNEKDPTRASVLNALESVRQLKDMFEGLYPDADIVPALYDIRTGEVDFSI